ncbi:hypothetical protein AB0H58_32460 [Nocardia neocaledoniensis]|uniref:hypothetical protein n=1 Tax=Nocardia neocaledoniensis TaxID=236511 RepID=UPI0033CEC6C9
MNDRHEARQAATAKIGAIGFSVALPVLAVIWIASIDHARESGTAVVPTLPQPMPCEILCDTTH